MEPRWRAPHELRVEGSSVTARRHTERVTASHGRPEVAPSDGIVDPSRPPTDGRGEHVRFTSGPSVSPDGSAFAHIVDDGGYPQAVQRFLTNRRTSSARWVTLPVDGPVTHIRYSPDGRWLALQAAPHGGTRSQVWVVTNDPTDPSAWRLGSDEDLSVELVGWDGDRVALTAIDRTGCYESRVVDPASGHSTVVDRRPLGRLVDAWAGDALVRTGPRSYRQVVLRRADGTTVDLLPPDIGSTTEMGVIVDPARARLAEHRHHAAPPATQLQVLLRSDHGSEHARLLLVTAVDGRVAHRVLAEQEGCDLDEFCVSADATTVALLWNRRGRSELHVLDLRSGAVRDITLPGLVASQLSISARGTLLALTVEGPGMPPSVQLVDARTGEWGPVEAARTEIDWFRTPTLHTFLARDGVELSGWLHHGAEPAQPERAPVPMPVVLYFHGGPEAQERPGHSYLFPALTAAGIDVFAPNVRGSTGSGRTYSHADEGSRRWAGIDDVADCVRYLCDAGLAVPGRIGITGRSYGGYLTYAGLVRFPELFAAGVAICGMSDLQSFYANTEPWIAAAAVTKYGDPVDDAALLRDLSPIHHIGRLQAPLLVVHGAHDTNVPVSESEQIVQAASERGASAELLLFPDEGHEIVKRENQAHLARTMVEWFCRHLAADR